MKIHKKHIFQTIIGVFISLISILAITFTYELVKTNAYLSKEIKEILPLSLKKHINNEISNSESYTFNYENPSPETIGKYKVRTIKTADTTLTYQSKIVNLEEHILRSFQMVQLMTNKLNPQPVHAIFDSLLQTRKIYHTQSAIGITTSFLKKMNEWSGDTTALSVNYRTSLINQGEFEDINYHAYIDYSFLTYWKLMNKTGIYVLLALCTATGLLLLGWKIKETIEMKQGVTLLPDGSYRLKNIRIDLETQKAITPTEEITLTNQQNQLLALFLRHDSQKVPKATIIQELWPKIETSSNNMTSAIKRLKDTLEKAGCAYTIIFEKEGDQPYYQLIRKNKTSNSQN